MEKFNYSHDNLPSAPQSINEALEKNPKLVSQAFEGIGYNSPDEFFAGNKYIKDEGFADLFGQLAGLDYSDETRRVSANALAFVDLTAKLYGKELDGLGGFDYFFVNGEPISVDQVDQLLQPYLEQNQSVFKLIGQFKSRIDPAESNPKSVERLLAIGFYLVDETQEMQKEDQETAEYDHQFNEIIGNRTESVQQPTDNERDQNYYDAKFYEITSEMYPAPMSDYDKDFFEIVEGVDIDTRTQADFDNELGQIALKNHLSSKDPSRDAPSQLAKSAEELAEASSRLAQTARDFWSGEYFRKGIGRTPKDDSNSN